MKTRLDFATVLALGIVLSLFSACVLVARGYLLRHDVGPERVRLTLPGYRVAPTADALR